MELTPQVDPATAAATATAVRTPATRKRPRAVSTTDHAPLTTIAVIEAGIATEPNVPESMHTVLREEQEESFLIPVEEHEQGLWESDSDGEDELEPEDDIAENGVEPVHEVNPSPYQKRKGGVEDESFPSLMVDMVEPDEPRNAKEHAQAIEREIQAFNETLIKDGRTSARKTQNNYRTWLSQWKIFCQHLEYDGITFRYDVEPNKAMAFFKEVVFRRKVAKYFHPSELKPRRVPICLCSELPAMAAHLHPVSDNDVRRAGREVDTCKEGEEDGEEDGESTKSSDQPQLEDLTASIQSEKTLDLRRLLDSLPVDNKGRKKVICPLGFESVDQAWKALAHLQLRQSQRLTAKNLSNHIRKSSVIQLLFNARQRELVYGELREGKDMVKRCVIRDSYTIQDHIRILGDTWRAFGETPLLLALREHFALSVRHSMLLRDEDLRHLNQSDCFMNEVRDPHGGTQTISMMVFSMHKGKTNQDGRTQYGTAVRHKDVRRCSIGAMAFYFFERWVDFGGDPTLPGAVPMFDHNWTGHKVLHAGGKESNREISYAATRDSTYKVLRRQNVNCPHITHSGRHSGVLEGQRMGMAEADIRIAGRWVQETGKMQQLYPSNFPSTFALGIAGHLGKPFHLKRNEVWPSVELQRQVFPFIEDALFPSGTEEHKRWVEECMDAMIDKSVNRAEDLTDVEPYAGTEVKTGGGYNRYQKRAQRSFLLMLVACRRVILQDAAAYIALYNAKKRANPDMTATLLDHNPVLAREVFSSEEFTTLQNDVAVVLEATVIPPLPTMDPVVVHSFKCMGADVKDIHRKLLEVERSQHSAVAKYTFMQYAEWQQELEKNRIEQRREDRQWIHDILTAHSSIHSHTHNPSISPYPPYSPYPPHPPHTPYSPYLSFSAWPSHAFHPSMPFVHHLHQQQMSNPSSHATCQPPVQQTQQQQQQAQQQQQQQQQQQPMRMRPSATTLPRPSPSHTTHPSVRPLPAIVPAIVMSPSNCQTSGPVSRRPPSIPLKITALPTVTTTTASPSLASYLSRGPSARPRTRDPSREASNQCPSEKFKVRMEKAHGNFCLTVQQIWNEHQDYQDYKKKHGRIPIMEEKEKKQLNNRLRIIEELQAIMKGPPIRTLEQAIRDLEEVKQENGFDATNELVIYCREQKSRRKNKGKGVAMDTATATATVIAM